MALTTALCFLFLWPSGADLALDLYKSAQTSGHLSAVPAEVEKISDFVKKERKTKHIALLVHDANCPHCRHALPELEQVAVRLSKEPVLLGHIDATYQKGAMKSAFDLKGFPCLLFWSQMADSLEDWVNKSYVVEEDEAALLRASQLAGLGRERGKARLAAMGQTVTVRKGDDSDMTVQVETATQQLVWIPHEVLLEKGRRVPYRRANALVKYQSLWEKDLMQQFLQRRMQPLVQPLDSLKTLQVPSLVLCGATAPRGFLEAAVRNPQLVSYQGRCKELSEGDQVLVYSPSSLQWSAVPGRAPAAVAMAGVEVLSDDGKLVNWVDQNRYPGITALTIRSVHDWLNGGRPVVLAAVRLRDLESNAVVEEQLRRVAKPRRLGDLEVYHYGPQDRYLGVADGTLEGFDYFGVQATQLPRVVVFDDHDHWVEDATYLQAEKLSEHLPRVATMWRMSHSPRGYVLWVAKQCVAFYLDLDRKADASVGYYGRCLVVTGVAMVFWIQARLLLWVIQGAIQMVREMFVIEADQAKQTGQSSPKKEKKKDK